MLPNDLSMCIVKNATLKRYIKYFLEPKYTAQKKFYNNIFECQILSTTIKHVSNVSKILRFLPRTSHFMKKFRLISQDKIFFSRHRRSAPIVDSSVDSPGAMNALFIAENAARRNATLFLSTRQTSLSPSTIMTFGFQINGTRKNMDAILILKDLFLSNLRSL